MRFTGMWDHPATSSTIPRMLDSSLREASLQGAHLTTALVPASTVCRHDHRYSHSTVYGSVMKQKPQPVYPSALTLPSISQSSKQCPTTPNQQAPPALAHLRRSWLLSFALGGVRPPLRSDMPRPSKIPA